MLLKICPGLAERLAEASDEEVGLIADLVRPPAPLRIVLTPSFADPKGCEWRPIRRHKNNEISCY